MIVKSAQFVTSAVKPIQYPPPDYPEVAFAGRSNVGKSTLINVLVNRRKLVKTSNTPGRTRLINFFLVNGDLYFVDLPGFGYARVPFAVKQQWGPMVEAYIAGRSNLKAVVLLMDVRREPGVEELNLIAWLAQYRIPVVPVMTKADKLSRNKQQGQVRLAARALETEAQSLILFSAKTRQGLDALWAGIENYLGGASPGAKT